MGHTRTLLLLISLLLISTKGFTQDTIRVKNRTYIGKIISIDSIASIARFEEATTGRKLILPIIIDDTTFSSSKSQLNNYFVDISDLDPERYLDRRSSYFSQPANFAYGPWTVSLDFISLIFFSGYNEPSNPNASIFLSYNFAPRMGAEVSFTKGFDVPTVDSYTFSNEDTWSKSLNHSFGVNILFYPLDHIKLSPILGLMFRNSLGSGYSESNYTYYTPSLDPDFPDDLDWVRNEMEFQLISNRFWDRGFILGYRANITSSVNFEMRLPIFSTNAYSALNKYESYSTIDNGESFELDYRDDYDYREWVIQLKFLLIYRLGGKKR